MSNTITGDVAGPMEGTNVDDSNEGVIHVADNVHKIYPSSPGIKAVHIYLIDLGRTDSNGSSV